MPEGWKPGDPLTDDVVDDIIQPSREVGGDDGWARKPQLFTLDTEPDTIECPTCNCQIGLSGDPEHDREYVCFRCKVFYVLSSGVDAVIKDIISEPEDALGDDVSLSLPRIPLDLWYIGGLLLAGAMVWAAWTFGLIGLVLR